MGHVRPQPGKYKPAENCTKYMIDRTAADILATDENFRKRCTELGITPTIRQARDWRRKLGRFTAK